MSKEQQENVISFPSKTEHRAIRTVDLHLNETGLSVERLFQFALWFDGEPQKLRSAFITELHRRLRSERGWE